MSIELQIASGSAATAAADAVVIGVHPAAGDGTGTGGVELSAGGTELEAAFAGAGGLAALLATVGATGKADEIVKIPTQGAIAAALLVAVGLGKPAEDGSVAAETVRRASGVAARALAGVGHAVSTLGLLDVAATAEGTILGGYTFTEYRSSTPGKAPVGRVDVLAGPGGDAEAVLRVAVATARAVCTARDLVNTPPNDLYPAALADRAATLAKAAGLTVEVLDDTALLEGGYGGISGVGQGSSRKPRLVRITWAGAAQDSDRPTKKVALVGKGVTFDTGGISIKPAANMDHMTSDMGGAAAMIAVTILAAQLELAVAVTATIPIAENMPSDTAYRPGDVLRMYNGKTVEVLNTDAEGRLILVDAIARAAEDSPDYLVETSTLTGAQMVALGLRTAGVMGSDAFRDRVAAVGTSVGEDTWTMPLPDYLRESLDSRVADIANVAGNRYGGMLTAGIFIREFVPAGLEWAHIDIAGPSFHTSGPYGYTTKGGTGVPVRTIAALLQDIAANG